MKILFFSISIIFCSTFAIGQTSHKNLIAGDKYYNNQEYYLAEEQYRKAREEEKEIKATFNLGNTVYLQERYEEAVDHFETATALADNEIQRSNAYYNLGNALFQNQKVEEALDAFKEAVVLNPENEEAKYNLLVTKQILKQLQQEEQKKQCDNPQPSEDQNQEDQEKQDQEQQEQQPQDQPQDGQQEPQDQDQEEQDQEEAQDSTNQEQEMEEGGGSFDSTRLDKQTLDSLDAMKLLQIIENEEQKVQEKLRKFNSDRKKADKDW